jgi:hypothetical protein
MICLSLPSSLLARLRSSSPLLPLCSGARLAWDFFWPDKQVPDLINFIEDRDLWRFAMPNSKQFFSGFEAVPFTFPDYDAFLRQVGVCVYVCVCVCVCVCVYLECTPV